MQCEDLISSSRFTSVNNSSGCPELRWPPQEWEVASMSSDDDVLVGQLGDRLAQLGRAFRLIVTGGGTGGHTYPALTTILELERRLGAHDSSLEVLWIGTAGGLEARVAMQEGIRFAAVPTGSCADRPIRCACSAHRTCAT